MKMLQCSERCGDLNRQNGFSLLEIIVALILIGITGALMFPVMRTNLTQSAVPVRRLDSQYLLIQEMDRLTGLYRHEIQNDTLDINTFKTTHVDISPLVQAVDTGFLAVGQITGNSYNTQSPNILRVTLEDGEARLVSFFTE